MEKGPLHRSSEGSVPVQMVQVSSAQANGRRQSPDLSIGSSAPTTKEINTAAGKSLTPPGAEGQDRTDDTGFFRPVLYQLSYLGSGTEGYPTRA